MEWIHLRRTNFSRRWVIIALWIKKKLKFVKLESGHEKDRTTREDMATKMGVMDDPRTSKIPLMYYIVTAFQNHEES